MVVGEGVLNVVAASKASFRCGLRDPEGFLGSNTTCDMQHANVTLLKKVGHLIHNIIQVDVLCQGWAGGSSKRPF